MTFRKNACENGAEPWAGCFKNEFESIKISNDEKIPYDTVWFLHFLENDRIWQYVEKIWTFGVLRQYKKQNQGIKIEVNCQNDQLVNCEGTNQPTVGHNVADTWPTLANLDQHALKFWRNDGQFVRKLWVWSNAEMRRSWRSQRMLKIEYVVAIIGFDTAENEPSKDILLCFLIPQILK